MAIYTELHRPQFHFSAKKNWINDPNGLVYRDGIWHLFFQHNRLAPVWGEMSWGHAVSDDLLHWRELEIALEPDDMGDMFSGSAVVDEHNTAGFGAGALLAFYPAAGFADKPTASLKRVPNGAHTQCLAYSVDSGKQWTKFSDNPLVAEMSKGNRDPKVVWHEASQRWVMALYLSEDEYCLLTSPDAKSWELRQRFRFSGESECPDFFPLRDQAGQEHWVFWAAGGHYQLGRFDGEAFVPESPVLLGEFGPNGYAAQTWSDAPNDRRIQISWMAGGLYPEMPFNQQMSLPVELSLTGEGEDARLVRQPVREIEALRLRSVHPDSVAVTPSASFVVPTNAKLLDVSFTVEKGTAAVFYLVIRGQSMVFDFRDGRLRFRPSDVPKVKPTPEYVELPNEEHLDVRLIVDLTSVEIFIQGGRMSASFCFLPGAYVNTLVANAYGGDLRLRDIAVHELASAWRREAGR